MFRTYAQTPPKGWNSWDSFGSDEQARLPAAAKEWLRKRLLSPRTLSRCMSQGRKRTGN
ncbi:hypothetical protein [uncultured Trichococcus sp.]|uniref:hypothetical protein n=1 Tax=uncultured Trichococcus sp. TaxID=189665 RepID=UPI002A18B5AF|nr:hypothetical protein [uncultured Trichococcus sp.]